MALHSVNVESINELNHALLFCIIDEAIKRYRIPYRVHIGSHFAFSSLTLYSMSKLIDNHLYTDIVGMKIESTKTKICLE